MDHIFQPYLYHFVLVLFDDKLVNNKNLVAHMAHVDNVLQIYNHQLFLKHFKCAFGVSQEDYLVHVVSGEDMCIDPKKIEAMMEWSYPKTLKC